MLNSTDFKACLVITGVTFRSHHYGYCCIFFKVQRLSFKRSTNGREAKIRQIIFQSHHDWLGLWITKTTIELNHVDIIILINHQPGVQEPNIGVSFLGHAGECRFNNLFHDLCVDFVSYNRGRRIGTHSSRIRPFIAIIYRFVILRCCEGYCDLTIGNHNKAGLLAREKLFNHHTLASAAEAIFLHHLSNRGFRLVQRLSDHNTLARSQTISFKHDGQCDGFQIGKSRFRGIKTAIFSGGNTVFLKEVFCENFRAFQLSCGH